MENQKAVRGFTTDLVSVMVHVKEAMGRHDGEALQKLVGGHQAMSGTVHFLGRSIQLLETRVEEIGGGGEAKELLTTVSGFFAGVYGQLRREPVSRMLRDDYAAMHFVSVCAGMLHTTAVGLGDMRTGGVVAGILKELPSWSLRIFELVPHAVVAELARDYHPINRGAAEHTNRMMRDGWDGVP